MCPPDFELLAREIFTYGHPNYAPPCSGYEWDEEPKILARHLQEAYEQGVADKQAEVDERSKAFDGPEV